MTMTDQIVALVKERDHVSFAELGRYIDGFEDKGGDLAVTYDDEFDNIILWVGLTKAGSDALRQAMTEKRIHWKQTDLLVYMADGGLLKMPLARRLHHYREPHWLPVVWRPGPAPKAKGRPRA